MIVYILYGVLAIDHNITIPEPAVFKSADQCLKMVDKNEKEFLKKFKTVQLKCVRSELK
jgi:hypothetical protein